MVDADDVLSRIGADPRALPRLATLVENEDPKGLAVLDALYPRSGRAHVLGITGPPGVGKSTLIAALLEPIRATNRRVAVLAVDPSSSLSGGAVLGDRIRMMARHGDAGVFVRSMASRGRSGGLAWATAEIVYLLDAAGYPLILVETVGTGQDGTDIASLADTVVVVEAPGFGNGVQGIKAGLLEVGDVVVVNKADQAGADDAVRLLRASLALARPADGRVTPVVRTVAATGEGTPELLAAVDDHGRWLQSTGRQGPRRERAARAAVLAGLRAALDRQLDSEAARSRHVADVIKRVASRELAPRRAIDSLIASLVPPRSA